MAAAAEIHGCSITPPQTVHVAFMSLRPMFFTRGKMEKESHGEEKEQEIEIEDLKCASL
jgi:hypothetical protein